MSGEHFPRGSTAELEDKPQSECGAVGVYAPSPNHDVRWMAYKALGVLQHRGQESAGIVVMDEIRIWPPMNELGLAKEVFKSGKRLSYLPENTPFALAHVRYGTCIFEGYADLKEEEQADLMKAAAMPMTRFSQDRRVQIALGFNGDVPNYKDFINAEPETLSDAVSDGDIITRLILSEVNNGSAPVEAIKTVANRLIGSAFSLVILFSDKQRNQEGMVALKDPNGFRPLALGSLEGSEPGWIVASESPAITMNGAKYVREIKAGEMLVIDKTGLRSEIIYPPEAINETFCAMEEIYLERPDSQIDGEPSEAMRFRSGQLLARRYPVEADMVVPVPESGLAAGNGFAFESGLPLRQGLIKNRAATERTFIAPGKRREGVFAKLVANPGTVKGKRLILVDDSIVRGNTVKALVESLREAGASEIHIRVASPPIISECHYGIDISTKAELIAHERTIPEIEKEINANSLAYLTLPNLKKVIGAAAVNRCYGCMTGEYPTPLRKPEAINA